MALHTILVVDDEKNMRFLYSQELVEEGYNVLTAENGKEALSIIENSEVSLVVLDIKLKDENGLDLLQKIVKENHCLPVVISSAYSHYKDDFSSWLADAYVVKSGDLKELKQEIKTILIEKTGGFR